ncbi:hypothetical protein V1264_006896 [Littorina saxatilis]|uniref:Uncharacterized protein n=2 Tax=Littorina saxatilis TaxID=31220 RepID=A0AAN9B0F8_9CAEN
MITNHETATSPSTMSTNRPSSLTTQEVTSTTTADLATDVSAGSASTTHLSSPKPDSSTADVTTAGSMTSLETSTTQETDSSTADMTTAGSMISREMSTSQETDSSKADVATAGSMISRETSTAQTTHASSTQTRNPSTTGNLRVALPTKRSRSCQCVLSVPSNTTERTVTAVVKNMTDIRQSLLVNKTQTGKTIRKKTSAGDERTSAKIGGFAAVVFLASVCIFLFSFDFLALIGYCRTYLKRRKATSP